MNEPRFFNDEKIIDSYRFEDLTEFYEMLSPTRIEQATEIRNVYKWADWCRKKDVPYVMTKNFSNTGAEYVRFYVFGIEKKRK